MGQDSNEYIKIKRSELEKIVDQKVKERLKDRKDLETPDQNDKISRRSFLKKIGAGAVGLGAIGLNPVSSQLKITKNGLFNAGSVNTEKASIKNESYVEASRTNNNSSNSAGTLVNIVDTEDKDKLGELDSNLRFNPQETGIYLVAANARFSNGSSGDDYLLRLYNVSDSTLVNQIHPESSGSSPVFHATFIERLEKGKTYRVEAANRNSSFQINAGSNFRILRSVVDP